MIEGKVNDDDYDDDGVIVYDYDDTLMVVLLIYWQGTN